MKLLESALDDFDFGKRRKALAALAAQVRAGETALPEAGEVINLHCHTFYSYNSYGYSPSHYAWLARKQGLAVAGIVDFDVLDGLDEFLSAADLLGLRACVGMETRAFVPEFADREMTSPGEPGITYHMGVGFVKTPANEGDQAFLEGLKATAQQRNQALIKRVNAYLDPVQLDYEADVLVLTPKRNPTERHICLAYVRKAQRHFTDDQQLEQFWADKLGVSADSLDLPEGLTLLNTLRSKTMKRGGVGYAQPDQGSFPTMAAINRFTMNNGGIPTLTWLNGLSVGEQAMEELLDAAMSTGVAAVNIIPDRNYTPGVADQLLANLNQIVEIANSRHLPIIVGTEMNSPGQKFVDSFETAELSRLLPTFSRGAFIVYGHTVMQRYGQKGYCSAWAKQQLQTPLLKNEFYEAVGRSVRPGNTANLNHQPADADPQDILKAIHSSI